MVLEVFLEALDVAFQDFFLRCDHLGLKLLQCLRTVQEHIRERAPECEAGLRKPQPLQYQRPLLRRPEKVFLRLQGCFRLPGRISQKCKP